MEIRTVKFEAAGKVIGVEEIDTCSAGVLAKVKMGGVVCLKREEGKWSVEWMVVPEILK